MSDTTQQDLARGIERLHAIQIGETGEYLYRADETPEVLYYVADEDDVAELGRRLADDQDGDAYSLWCADTTAHEADYYQMDAAGVAPQIEVLGLGSSHWTVDDEEQAAHLAEWERYGTVEVRIGDRLYDVGCVIGVLESQRGSAQASGCYASGHFLSAWYEEYSDWSGARIPQVLADAVLSAIGSQVRRLWAEYERSCE